MKIYAVYRGQDLKASIRIWGTNTIEWTYPLHEAAWNGLWWSHEHKEAIEDIIQTCPRLEEFPLGIFIVRLRQIDVISL
jgi:hypothetical protein